MNCDLIARWYRWCEWAVFGFALQQRRLAFLRNIAAAESGLVLGDGDGRFLSGLLASAPLVRIDAVEASRKMIALAEARITEMDAVHVRFYCADARSYEFQPAKYDLVVTHFFLDCFSDDDLRHLVPRLAKAARPAAQWVVSEFSVPSSLLMRWRAKAWIRLLYWCFGWATGLRVRRLPDFRAALANAGFRLEREEFASWGLLTSQLWRKSAEPEKGPGRQQRHVGQNAQRRGPDAVARGVEHKEETGCEHQRKKT